MQTMVGGTLLVGEVKLTPCAIENIPEFTSMRLLDTSDTQFLH